MLMFSPEGELEHELDIGCSPSGHGRRFRRRVCLHRMRGLGFLRKVVVMDAATLEVMKVFDEVYPPGEDIYETSFYITAVEEVAGQILVIGYGGPPKGYQRVTNHAAAYTRVGMIDPETLTIRRFVVHELRRHF